VVVEGPAIATPHRQMPGVTILIEAATGRPEHVIGPQPIPMIEGRSAPDREFEPVDR